MKKSIILKVFPAAILTAILLFIPSFSLAQNTVIKGIITDEEGNPLEGAEITLVDPTRGLKFHLQSDKKGKFIKVGIPSAVYMVTVELEGYFPLQSQTRISMGFIENIEIKLKKIPRSLEGDKDLDEGASLFKEEKYDEAIASFKRIIEKFPTNYEGYYNLGLSYMKKDDYDQAVAALEKATELNPDALVAHFALGECYFAKEESEKATDCFSRAIALEPENPLAYYNLGIVYYKLDKNGKALASFEKAIELNPKLASAYYQSALIEIKLGNFEKAIQLFEKFLEIEPDAAEAAQVKTMIKELKKQIKDTIEV